MAKEKHVVIAHELVCPMCGVIGAMRVNEHHASCGDCGSAYPLGVVLAANKASKRAGLFETEPNADDTLGFDTLADTPISE